jgi:hypothetical protein
MFTSTTVPRKLNLSKVMLGAVVSAWRLRAAILRQAGLAMAAQVLIMLLWTLFAEQLPAAVGWIIYFFNLAFMLIIAVRCHRLVLAKGGQVEGIAMPTLEMRELRFLVAMFTTWLPAMAVMVFASFILFNVMLNVMETEGPARSALLDWLAWIPAGYIAGRLCLKMPAAAIDRFMDIASAVDATRGNGWKMVIVVAIIPWLIAQLSGQLFSMDGGPALMLLSCIAAQLLVAVEVMALSIAYQELVEGAGEAALQ